MATTKEILPGASDNRAAGYAEHIAGLEAQLELCIASIFDLARQKQALALRNAELECSIAWLVSTSPADRKAAGR